MDLDYTTGAKPLWSQVADTLRQRIKNDEYKVGESIPPEMQLIEDFRVSRTTIRQALEFLVNEEYIIRQRGKGTIVQKKSDVSTSMKSSLVSLKENSIDAKKKLIDVRIVPADKEIADFFGVKKNKNVIQMTRCTQVNNRILAIYITYMNPNISISLKDDFSDSFYKLLKSKNFAVTSGKEEITATISTEEDHKLFNLKEDMAIITRKKFGFSKDVPVELTFTRYIADDYMLTIELNE